MCGIVAVINKQEDAFKEALVGIMALQHRGQDSAGIASDKEGTISLKKRKGLVHEVFDAEDASVLKGNMAVSHARYATQGGGSIEDAQPLVSESGIVFAQNGNMTNYFEMKKSLEKKGIVFGTSVDTEAMMHVFSEGYDESEDFFSAAEKFLENVKGGYAVAGIIPGKGIFAIRDPCGIRPLVLGMRKDSYMFASESVAFQTADYDLVRDIKPGEAVFIDKNLQVHNRIIKEGKCRHCMFEWVYFASPNSMIEGRSVYKARLALGKLMARHVDKSNSDLVVPVPDSGRTAAIKLAESAEIRYREGLIKNKYIPRTFIMNTQKKREEAVIRKLMPIISILKDKRVTIVDDSIVRGTTSKMIVQVLKSGGVERLSFVSTCPPIRYPCYYGIDMANNNEFIAYNKDIEEVRQYLTADDLFYASTGDVECAIRRDVCMACLTGQYPVNVSEEEEAALGCQRSMQHEKEEKNGEE